MGNTKYKLLCSLLSYNALCFIILAFCSSYYSVLPYKQKTDHQNQKKTILVSWPLHVGLYHAIRQPVKNGTCKKHFCTDPAANPRQVVQPEAKQNKTRASCQCAECLRVRIIIQLIVGASYFAFYRVKGTNICPTFRKRLNFAENISK